MDALAKMTWQPAQRLENPVPAMQHKGRVKVGADAVITVFDTASLIDRATFETPMQPSSGVVHVLVSGIPVVRNGGLVGDARPGRPIRRTVIREGGAWELRPTDHPLAADAGRCDPKPPRLKRLSSRPR